MVPEIRRNREFATIEGGIANSIYALVRHHFQRDKIASRTGDDDIGADDFHGDFLEVRSLEMMLPYK